MTAADIPAPPGGWRMACTCGLPVMLGTGTFHEACLGALEHLRVCPPNATKATVALAVAAVVDTTMWTSREHYQVYRNLLYAARRDAAGVASSPVRSVGGCGACG
jgi:hypothetical protein